MSEALQAASQKVFDTICRAMESLAYAYEAVSQRQIDFSVSGKDIPMRFSMAVSEEKQIVVLYSPLPFSVEADKVTELSVALCSVNYRLADGSFDYDIPSGAVSFRMTANYLDSEIGFELLDYMIRCSVMTVDRYNDKLLMLSRGLMTLDEFHREIGFQ